MKTKIIKKGFRTLIISLIIMVTMAITVSAGCGVLCNICRDEADHLVCTGVDRTTERSHKYGPFWRYTCFYSTPTHQVATNCCEADFGVHIYKEYTHPDCKEYEEEFPCSEIPNWIVE